MSVEGPEFVQFLKEKPNISLMDKTKKIKKRIMITIR